MSAHGFRFLLQLLAQCVERLLDFFEALVPGKHDALLVCFELFRLLLAYARELDTGDLILHLDRGCEHTQPLVNLLTNLLGQRANLLGILLAFSLLGEALDFGDRVRLDGGDVLWAA